MCNSLSQEKRKKNLFFFYMYLYTKHLTLLTFEDIICEQSTYHWPIYQLGSTPSFNQTCVCGWNFLPHLKLNRNKACSAKLFFSGDIYLSQTLLRTEITSISLIKAFSTFILCSIGYYPSPAF